MKTGDRVQTELGPGEVVDFWKQTTRGRFGLPRRQAFVVVQLDGQTGLGYRRPFQANQLEPERGPNADEDAHKR